MWGIPQVNLNTPAIVKIEWAPNSGTSTEIFVNSGVSIQDTSITPFDLAYVTSKPPRDSLARMFMSVQGTGTAALVELTWPAGAIVDLELEAVLNYGEPAATGPTLSAGTVGTLVWNSLCGGTLVAQDPLNST